MKKSMKDNQKGFTLIELIIVIAVMGIIAAVLVPSFTQMTAKAKVSTDIRSIQMVQSQLELYKAEHNKYPGGSDTVTKPTTDVVIKTLVDAGYLEGQSGDNIAGATRIGLQSGCTIVWDEKEGNLAIGKTNPVNATVDKIIKGLASGTDADHVNATGIPQ